MRLKLDFTQINSCIDAYFVESECIIRTDFGQTTIVEKAALPSGGFSGDWLVKGSNLDYDVLWSSPDYNDLNNKPSIEGVPLVGDQTFAQLRMTSLTNTEIENLLTL